MAYGDDGYGDGGYGVTATPTPDTPSIPVSALVVDGPVQPVGLLGTPENHYIQYSE